MSDFVRLAPDQLDELADLIAARLRCDQPVGLVDAMTVAKALGMKAGWVRENAAELGAVRLGDGPKPRLRFDLEKATAAWAARSAGERSLRAAPAPQAKTRRRRTSASATTIDLLPVRGHEEARRAA
jgi:hypothetical protein